MTCQECQLEIFDADLGDSTNRVAPSPAALIHISLCDDCRALDREARLNAQALAELRREPLPVAPRPWTAGPWRLAPGRILPWIAATAAAAAALALLLWPSPEESRLRAHAPKPAPKPFVFAHRTAPPPAPRFNPDAFTPDLRAPALRLPDLPATAFPTNRVLLTPASLAAPALPAPLSLEASLTQPVTLEPVLPILPANRDVLSPPAPPLRAATNGSGPSISPVPQVQPLLIKILTDDPNVVIYLVPDAPSEQAL